LVKGRVFLGPEAFALKKKKWTKKSQSLIRARELGTEKMGRGFSKASKKFPKNRPSRKAAKVHKVLEKKNLSKVAKKGKGLQNILPRS